MTVGMPGTNLTNCISTVYCQLIQALEQVTLFNSKEYTTYNQTAIAPRNNPFNKGFRVRKWRQDWESLWSCLLACLSMGKILLLPETAVVNKIGIWLCLFPLIPTWPNRETGFWRYLFTNKSKRHFEEQKSLHPAAEWAWPSWRG